MAELERIYKDTDTGGWGWVTQEATGGGGLAPNGVVLVLNDLTALDLHANGVYPVAWDGAVDNLNDFNPVASIPGDVGLTNPLDGTVSDLTTTVDGVWSVMMLMEFPQDATFEGVYGTSLAGNDFGNAIFPSTTGLAIGHTQVFYLPSGQQFDVRASSLVDSTADPYNLNTCLAAVSRLL